MRVAFDAERLRSPNSGLGQLCRRLGEALIQHRPPGAELTFVVPTGQGAAFGPGVRYEEATWRRRFWSPSGPDIWHATHQDSWIRPPRGAREVLSIMDLNFLDRTDYSERKKAGRLAAVQRKIDRASAVATISDFTASVVRQHLRVDATPLRVIYLGNPVDPLAPATEPDFAKRLEGRPFFMFVGVLHPKKNVKVLVPLMHELPEWRLVIAGPDGHPYARELHAEVVAAGLGDRVIIPGAVSDAVKRWLYVKTDGLLFPSLSEGFGLPVVEAMSFGKPVFLSHLTSLPEIGGDAARYFESFEPRSMAVTIRAGLADHAAHPERAGQLRAAASRFTWERTATEYWDLYESVLRGAP